MWGPPARDRFFRVGTVGIDEQYAPVALGLHLRKVMIDALLGDVPIEPPPVTTQPRRRWRIGKTPGKEITWTGFAFARSSKRARSLRGLRMSQKRRNHPNEKKYERRETEVVLLTCHGLHSDI
jgi:hypothetical protein